ncbi:MAG TPA: hypothetical protein VJP41_02090 [Gaiellaceae bacterium]|nr:hypothetical protein [Gaiellaceae bacterium]
MRRRIGIVVVIAAAAVAATATAWIASAQAGVRRSALAGSM